MIYDNRELSDIEKKFAYLRLHVTGPAKRVIEGVRLEQANYAVAVKKPQERFGRHTALVDDHIRQLACHRYCGLFPLAHYSGVHSTKKYAFAPDV
ncbi:hypothetical protein MRX96_015413 [Rhipicephalus microplus]